MFKKLISIIAGVFLLATPALAIDNWHAANGVSVQWDAVTEYCCEDPPIPIEPTTVVTYRVYVARMDKTDIKEMWEGTDLTCFIILAKNGKHLIGVDARIVEEGLDFPASEISWSDDPLVVNADAGTFAILYHGRPVKVLNLNRPQ